MPRRLSRIRLRTFAFALLPTILALLVVELGARFYEAGHPPRPVDFDAGFSAAARVFVPIGQGQVRTNPSKIVNFIDQTFSIRKAPGTFRIFALGESSVNYLQRNLQALAKSLETELQVPRVEIINAGGLSYGSQRLAIIAQELLGYEPDLLFLYLGHNEFEEVEQFHLTQSAMSPAVGFFYRFASVRVVSSFLLGAKLRQLEREHVERLASVNPNAARAWSTSFTREDVVERMRLFRANLESIVQAYRQRGVAVIMSSIPSNLMRPYLPKEGLEEYALVYRELARKDYPKARALAQEILRDSPGRHQSSSLENTILREVAAEHEIAFVDVEKAVTDAEPHHIPGETLFQDHCHLNAQGNDILANELHREIVTNFSGLAKSAAH